MLTLPEFPCITMQRVSSKSKVRKRYVCLQILLEKETKVNYTFITIVLRVKNLVSAYDSIFDRVNNTFDMLSLAQLIKERSALKVK